MNDEIFSNDDDWIELGDSDLVPIKDGWLYNKDTKETIDPDGRVYADDGQVVFDPEEFDDAERYFFDDDDYEWYGDDE
jgi:hypothetical protein